MTLQTNNKILFALLISLLLTACLPTGNSSEPINFNGPTSEWPQYGGVKNTDHYSPLTQITAENVDQLTIAWEHRSGDFSDGSDEWGFTSMQVTPIQVNNALYYCTPKGRSFALDPETGEELWMFDPEVRNKKSGLYPVLCRGVSYWEDKTATELQYCSKRILYGTRDAELLALDADTGALCESFGNGGRVSLREGIIDAEDWAYYPTTPPYITDNLAIIGAMVPDNDSIYAPSGVVRAFDVRSGELVWAWEPVPEDYKEHQRDKKGRIIYHQGTPNVWAPISGDPALGLIYVATGNPSPDVYAGQRNGIDDYGSSTIALDQSTGKVVWNFQTVHHDVWDYDVPSQPQTFQIPGVGNGRASILQATKTGHIFLLDRQTGEPLYPVEERPVPQNGVPGEKLSPTQPFPTHPKPLHLPAKLAEMDGFAIIDKYLCQKEFEKYRNDGIFTPPSLEGSVLFPYSSGGMNWGGVAIDPVNGVMYTNQMHFASIVQMIPREEFNVLNPPLGGYPDEYYRMEGTPYGVKRFPLSSIFGAPCVPRPWGSLTAVDLKSGEVLWKRELGTTRDQAPFPFWFDSGAPNTGGAVFTASGLLFIASTTDKYFRAFDGKSGQEIWRFRIPYTGNATPMSYRLSKTSKQYIVLAAGGHGWSEAGDALIAFSLPDKTP
jgi:quinoprotein glucose dehydrogenase